MRLVGVVFWGLTSGGSLKQVTATSRNLLSESVRSQEGILRVGFVWLEAGFGVGGIEGSFGMVGRVGIELLGMRLFRAFGGLRS